MNIQRFYFFPVIFSLFIAVPSLAQIYKGAQVCHVSLVSGNIVTGKGFTIGIRFQLEPGWHVYWKNPGDAGMPVSAEMLHSTGYTAGELKFPTPHKYDMGGDILYGYDSEVVFLLPVKAPSSPVAPQFDIKVNWLVCREVCLPGETTISFYADSVNSATKKDNQRLIDHWTARLPQPGDGFNFGKSGIVITEADTKRNIFIKFLEMTPGTVTDFFPEVIEGFVTDYRSVKITDEGISMTLTPETKDSKLSEIKGIAVIGRTGYEVKFSAH